MEEFWKNPNWEKNDPHLKKIFAAPFKRPFQDIQFKNGLHIIRGPRQIGKSSWLKNILSQALKAGLNCAYLSCEKIRNFQELGFILETLRGRDLILLDEITFVEEWARTIKYEIEQGHFKAIIITGSNSFDLRRGAERMPGRLAINGQLELLPMEYSEFSEMRKQANWPNLTRVQELELYFKIGGFPSALIEAGAEGRDPQIAKGIYKEWLLGDILKAGRHENYLREILGQIALTTTSTISLQKLAQKTQIASHHTAQAYVEILEDCFALKTLYAIDLDDGSYRFKKEKKFYFRDPLIYWLALEWAGFPVPLDAQSQIAEMVAAEALLRRHVRLGYLSSQKGEVDFLSPKKWALEVKWSSAISNISPAYTSLQIPEKMIWYKENFLAKWPN